MLLLLIILSTIQPTYPSSLQQSTSTSSIDKKSFAVFQSHFPHPGAGLSLHEEEEVSDVATDPSSHSSTKSYTSTVSQDHANLGSPHGSSAELDDEFVSIISDDAEEEPDSIDLSLSEIAEKARNNKNLSSDDLKNCALQLIRQRETLMNNRRALSKQRADSGKKIQKSSAALVLAQENYVKAKQDAIVLLALEQEERVTQEKIYQAMNLLYSTIMQSSEVSAVIKEQWEAARKPGKKLSHCESAYHSCNLL